MIRALVLFGTSEVFGSNKITKVVRATLLGLERKHLLFAFLALHFVVINILPTYEYIYAQLCVCHTKFVSRVLEGNGCIERFSSISVTVD